VDENALSALECGSLLPLSSRPACWPETILSTCPREQSRGKATASCRTPKRLRRSRGHADVLAISERFLRHLLNTSFAVSLLCAGALAQVSSSTSTSSASVRYDGADWKIKGDGVVCCPCTVPCPCRTNGPATYGHCEATLYLRVKQGNYGALDLGGLQIVRSGGMCDVNYERLSALYFDSSASAAQREAMMKLMASFSQQQVAEFPHVRAVPFVAQIAGDRLFNVALPGILEMIVDRNWGEASPPMPFVAAQDGFANALQYVQNIRYRMRDREAGLEFDYSRRQANYRLVDLTMEQYRSKSMLILFADGNGWFSPQQLELISAQHLVLPQLDVIRKEAQRLRITASH
jgi:hypothetical protein